MSVSKRLGRVSQCAVSLIGVACLSVFANTERNGFIGVEGDAEFYKDGDDTIGIHNPIGAVEVVIEARDGWRFDDGTTKKNVDHEIGKTNDFVLVGRDGESSTKNYLVDDVEHVHESIVSEKHTDNAAIEPESAPDEIILVYAEPDYGAVVPSNCASWRIVQKATHTTTTKEIPCHMPECQWGNGTSSETVEIGPELSELVFSCDVPGAKDGLLTFGHYKIGYYASWTNRFCIEKECHAAAGTNSEISVFKVSVSNDQYIGLDMTDAGKDKYVVKNAKAKIEPTPSKGRYDVSYEWNTNPLCEIVEETKTRQEASYQNLSHKQASAAYQDQRLECQVTISAKDSQRYGSATCTNNFTVVKVDVEIEMPDAKNAEENEAIEEKYGAYILYEKDYDEYSPFSPRAVDSLRKVTFKITPEDIPETDEIEIKVDEKCLYEREVKKNVTNYFEAASSYRYGDLKKKKFVLHGHAKSDALRDKQIEITHPKSGAIDRAKFTVVEMDLIPDYDRDHKIDDKDVKKVAAKQMFYWWLNDDADDGDCANCFADKGTEIPGAGPISKKNKDNGSVDGRTDLLDFFPLWTKLGHALDFCSKTESDKVSENLLTIQFSHKGLGFVMTRLDVGSAGNYLVQDSRAIREGINMLTPHADYLYEATVHKKGSEEFDSYYLDLIKENGSKSGILIVEGVDKTQDVRLELCRNKKPVLSVPFRCSIQSVLDMMNRIDLFGDEPVFTEMKIKDKTFAPLDKDVLYLHGFKVSQVNALGWHADAFKRLHQSGSEARFTGISWPGIVEDGARTGLYYHRCANNAFITAKRLAEFLSTELAGKLRSSTLYMAHSLGNMVVSSAIQDHNLSATQYFMLNGAVASEAYDESRYSPLKGEAQRLIYLPWRQGKEFHSGYPEESYCSAWHRLFEGDQTEAGKSRARLTWTGRFSDVAKRTEMINYYSLGDEVFELNDEDRVDQLEGGKLPWLDRVSFDGSQYCWQKQEMGKGVPGINFLKDSDMAGWGFNANGNEILAKYSEDKRMYRRDLAWKLANRPETVVAFKYIPVFKCNPGDVFGGDGGALSDLRINELLCCAIPAISTAMGRTTDVKSVVSVDMSESQSGWGRDNTYGKRWLHCDLKDMAYFYEAALWDDFVNRGKLKGE